MDTVHQKPATKNQQPEATEQDAGDAQRVKDRQRRTIGAQFPKHLHDTGEYPRETKK
jgi:hypothetical protein